ncbi:MarR family winged helix-turn-helix transcriptional regulator [Paraoerskovia marina]|uniref:MarR family winged helix-turn-helix transcriptional regulator n=1 Tax=Paraoerskovia marina TaxID=545619 RepID=UPI000694CDF2|nr:MarR family transcriptional regulator [Paraoerskovia marina]
MSSSEKDVERLDRALLRLRRFLTAPPVLPDGDDRVELSTLLVVDAAVRAAPASVKDVAEALVVTHSTASRLVGTAVDAGAVVRTPSQADRRTMLVEPTARGLAMLQRAVEFRLARLEGILDGWTPEEVAAFADSAERFADRATWR